MVEKESSETLNVLRTDNGGEFTSSQFQAYLKAEGVRHELTIMTSLALPTLYLPLCGGGGKERVW